MQITFLGATHEVTGSCTYVEAAGRRFLVDCGMEQGTNYYENQDLPISPSEVDFVLLTHAHIDHSGNLPLLYAKGFRGNIYTTDATKDLCDIMLKDSAHIQMFEAEWRNRKGKRSGKEEFIPLYTMDDALGAISQLVGCPYQEEIYLAEGIRVRFTDAGHLLGSSSIEIWLTEEGTEKKIVFSGDIGNVDQPLINNPQYIEMANYVVLESTYGDRSHKVNSTGGGREGALGYKVNSAGEVTDYVPNLAKVIQETFDKGGNLVIPSFAVGRTQEMLYFIRQIKEQQLVIGHDDFSVYVDSPLAVETTNIFRQHYRDCYDEEARRIIESGMNPISFSGLKLSVDSASSKAINFNEEPKVIISASGMCDAGRIKHHLKHNLWRSDSTILFVGYQARGTLGRALIEGAKTVKIFGEEIVVQAQVKALPGVSGHADNQGLMKWASSFKAKPQKVFVNHGDDQSCETLAQRLRDELHYDTMAPFSGTVYDLRNNLCIHEAQGVVITPKEKKVSRAATAFDRLLAAGQRLITVIHHNQGGTNKDLAKFTSQINSLSDKWER